MPADSRMPSRRQMWWTDHVNNASDSGEMLARTVRWMKAEITECRKRRPQDADGFEVHLAHYLAEFLRGMPHGVPAPAYIDGLVPLEGGGWTPSANAGPASNVVNP